LNDTHALRHAYSTAPGSARSGAVVCPTRLYVAILEPADRRPDPPTVSRDDRNVTPGQRQGCGHFVNIASVGAYEVSPTAAVY
jgi:short-subunit dehydrogenase